MPHAPATAPVHHRSAAADQEAAWFDEEFVGSEDEAPTSVPDASFRESSELGRLWLARGTSTLREALPEMTSSVFRKALAQPSGFDSLLIVIAEHMLTEASESQRERVERMIDLTHAKVALMERAGGAATVDEAAQLLGGVKRQAVERRRDRESLLAVRIGGEYRYPICQFHGGDVLPGLAQVLRAFTVTSSWTRLSLLLSPQDALGGSTMIEALHAGRVEDAVDVAAGFGDT